MKREAKTLKLVFLGSACIHVVIVGLLFSGIRFHRRRVPTEVYNVRIVEPKSVFPSVSKSAEASQVKPVKPAKKVKASAPEKKKAADEKKLDEFLEKRKRLEELRKQREEELKKEEKRKQQELKKLSRWSKELGDRKVLEEPAIDSGATVFPGWYVDEVYNRIFSSWEPPSAGSGAGARAGFDISRSGAVSNVVVEQSSGSSVFDFSCEEAVRKASPFSPLPNLFEGDRVRVHVTFKEQ